MTTRCTNLSVRRYLVIAALGLLCATGTAHAMDARQHIAQAKTLIEQQRYSFARSYLNPAVIAPFLSRGERAHAYYLRGFSFAAQDMHVSALRDYNRALEFDPDNATVLAEIGFAHAFGRGTTQDKALAFSFFEQAANRDHAEGHFQLGYALLNGSGTDKNVPAAREALSKAAAAGHNYAMLTLASSYRAPHVVEPQVELARQWYERAYAAGVSRALWFLGYMHANGEFGDVDHTQAVEYYQRALEEGVAVAGVSLAYAYLVGQGVTQDHARAFTLYHEAAEAQLSTGQVGLGHMYEHGLGVDSDLQQAQRWYVAAAEAGDLTAMRRLVALYLAQPDKEPRSQALQWSARAAESGSAQAQNDYAWLLATSKFAELRNGTLALSTAKAAVSQQPSAAFLDTLAAAYAELGNFDLAVTTQQQAIAAVAVDQINLRDELEQRLQRYLASEPWRE